MRAEARTTTDETPMMAQRGLILKEPGSWAEASNEFVAEKGD